MKIQQLELLILVLCVIADAAAFTAQVIFNIEPCDLCIWSRIPYNLVFLVMLTSWLFFRIKPQIRFILYCLIFIGGTALATYQVGLENKLWTEISSCSGTPTFNFTLDDLKNTAPVKSCGEPDYIFWKYSLADLNLKLLVFLTVLSFYGIRRTRQTLES